MHPFFGPLNCIHNLPVDRALSHSSLIYTLIPYLCKTLNVTFTSMSRSTKCSIPLTFPIFFMDLSSPPACCFSRQATFPLFYRLTKYRIMQLPSWSGYFHNVYAACRCMYTYPSSSVYILFFKAGFNSLKS
jgi:hypothetical protein